MISCRGRSNLASLKAIAPPTTNNTNPRKPNKPAPISASIPPIIISIPPTFFPTAPLPIPIVPPTKLRNTRVASTFLTYSPLIRSYPSGIKSYPNYVLIYFYVGFLSRL